MGYINKFNIVIVGNYSVGGAYDLGSEGAIVVAQNIDHRGVSSSGSTSISKREC